jgi:hypothetical protein
VNTYDPADGIVYCHIPREAGRNVVAGDRRGTDCRLPSGYANKSPRTRIRLT